MNRRRSQRQTRRLEVQFWQPGERVHHGYTTNLSASGMHIATQDPLPPRSRLRIEVIHGERGFLVEGVVAHRRVVHPELARAVHPGMGVRFLSPEELVNELMQATESFVLTGSPAVATTEARPGDGEEGTGASRTFSVRFASARDFLGIYERDIQNGGLFVATGRPARLREIVNIDLYPPEPAAQPVQLAARVVQRFQPQPDSGAILVGMGVELLDLPAALAKLQPVIERFENRAP
jgi:hypothetical protein